MNQGQADAPTPPTAGDRPAATSPDPEVDLDAVERDLDGVDTALGRLDDGTYWTDEASGEELPDAVLADDPTARRA